MGCPKIYCDVIPTQFNKGVTVEIHFDGQMADGRICDVVFKFRGVRESLLWIASRIEQAMK